MALGVVAFIAEQRDGAGRGARQGVEQRALGREVLAKVAEETLQVSIFAKSITQIARRAERALVCVPDALLGERGGECGLGESVAPGDRKLANVELNESVALAKERCTDAEFKAYRTVVGTLMGEMLLSVMNPLYKEHPDLKPKELL